MKFLLTSSGIRNTSIEAALVELLGKPIAESSALCIPTGVQPFPGGTVARLRVHKWIERRPHVRPGLEVVGSAGAHRATEHQEGVLGPGGRGGRRTAGLGRQSLVSLLLDAAVRPRRPLAVASTRDGLRRHERGCMVADPRLRGETYDDSEPLTGSDRALGLVDFSLSPHLEREDMPDTSLANVEKWAAGISVPAYAIDDQTAIKVVDGTVEVVSEGHWKLLTPGLEAR